MRERERKREGSEGFWSVLAVFFFFPRANVFTSMAGSVDISRASIKRPEIELDCRDARTSLLSATAQCDNKQIFQTAINNAKAPPTGFESTRSTTLLTAAKKEKKRKHANPTEMTYPSTKACQIA